MDPVIFLFLIFCGWASKGAVDHVKQSYRSDRDAKAADAEQKASAQGTKLSGLQRKRNASRHAAGWWAREVAGGFPVTRAGYGHGWRAHKTEHAQNKAQRQQARQLHKDVRASFREAQKAPGQDTQPQQQEELPRRHPSQQQQAKVLPWPERPLKAVPDLPPEDDEKRDQERDERPAKADTAPDQQPDPQKQDQPQGANVADNRNNNSGRNNDEQSETTYTQDLQFYDQLITELDEDLARLQARRIAERVEMAAEASLDPESVGYLADLADATEQQIKSTQQALDAAQAFRDNLVRTHGPGAEYHQGTSGGGATKGYLQE